MVNYYDPYTAAWAGGAGARRNPTNQFAPLDGINPIYGVPGHQWGGGERDVQQAYTAEHDFDPQTGGLRGPVPLPPAHLALLYQAQHDRAVWNRRYEMGRDALNMARGANRLLQSYRPGGSAAIEAGTYGQMANIQMGRAQMHQPLDLLADYRRDQIARSSSKGRKESTVGSVLQGVGALVSLIPGGQVAGAALMGVGAGVKSYGDSRTAEGAAQAQAGANTYSPNAVSGQQQGAQAAQQGQPQPAIPGGANPPGHQPGVPGEGAPAPQTPGGPNPPGHQPGAPGQGTAQATLGGGPGMAPPGQPGQMSGPEMGQGGDGGQAGMGMVGPPPVVGADRDFTIGAYAQHGAATTVVPDHMQAALSESMVDMIESDQVMMSMPYALDREMALRAGGI